MGNFIRELVGLEVEEEEAEPTLEEQVAAYEDALEAWVLGFTAQSRPVEPEAVRADRIRRGMDAPRIADVYRRPEGGGELELVEEDVVFPERATLQAQNDNAAAAYRAIQQQAQAIFPNDIPRQRYYMLLAMSEQSPALLSARQYTTELLDPEGSGNAEAYRIIDGVARGFGQIEADTATDMLISAIINENEDTVEGIVQPLIDALPEGQRLMINNRPVTTPQDLITNRGDYGISRSNKVGARQLIQGHLDLAEKGETAADREAARLAYERIMVRQRVRDLERGQGAAYNAAGGASKAQALNRMLPTIVDGEETVSSYLDVLERVAAGNASAEDLKKLQTLQDDWISHNAPRHSTAPNRQDYREKIEAFDTE